MKVLTEVYGQGEYSDRKAQVTLDENGDYGINYIATDFKEYRYFPDKSIHYAEDAAENWVIGVINPKELYNSFLD